MSHIADGLAITDIEAMALVIEKTCPTLEIVRQKEFRTFTTAGQTGLLGYVLPGFYQLKLIAQMLGDGLDVRGIFAKAGVHLPESLAAIESQPISETQHQALLQVPEYHAAMVKFCENTRNQDAEFVIRRKDKRGYEIGLVPHIDPARAGEYVTLTDTYGGGGGLFAAPGVGGLVIMPNGESVWGPELRRNYAICATERAIERQINDPSSAIYAMQRVTMPDGSIRIEALSN